MNKRVDQKKQRNKVQMNMLKKFLGIAFCIVLLFFLVYAADISTRRMIMCNDDKYALAVALQEDSMLRIDIAGEKFMLNVEPVIQVTGDIASRTRSCYEGLVKMIRAKMGR